MNAAIIYKNLAPFHFARLESAGKIWAKHNAQVSCIEIAKEEGSYSWGRREYVSNRFNYLTLFDHEYSSLKYRIIRQAINRALDKVKPDVVVINGWGHKESVAALGWCCRNGIPRVLVSDSQSIDSPRRLWKEAIKKSFVAQCHSGFAGGTSHVRYLVELGLPSEFCVTGCDVVDNEMFLPAGKFRRENPVSSDPRPLRILSCLRLLKVKNVPMALRSLSMLNMPWQWIIAGDGPERERITYCAESLGLRDCIQLQGHVAYNDLTHLYATADVYLQPSLSDTWGLAVNEAMASGLPVVVSKQCGCHEDLVAEGVNGYTFDPWSSKSLVAAMERFWERRSDWSQMGEASERIIKMWSLDYFAGNLWKACELAMARAQECNRARLVFTKLYQGL